MACVWVSGTLIKAPQTESCSRKLNRLPRTMTVEHCFAILSRPCKQNRSGGRCWILEMATISDFTSGIRRSKLNCSILQVSELHLKSQFEFIRERKVRTLQ